MIICLLFKIEKKENYIIFVGEYLHEYKDNFLKIFAEAVNSKELKGKGCTLKIVVIRISIKNKRKNLSMIWESVTTWNISIMYRSVNCMN